MEKHMWHIGIAGSGLIADFHAKAIRDLPNAKIVGFSDNGSGKSTALAKKYDCEAFHDYRKLIHHPDVQVITIAAPSGAHLEPAMEAAEAGKHVLCEKPMEINTDRVDQMIQAHEKAGTYLGGIFNFRHDEAIPEIKQAIEKDRFGSITCASVQVPWWRSDDYYKDSWHGTLALDGGGALMNQSIHMIDLLQYLMGEVAEIKAFTGRKGHPQIEAEDTGVAALQFTNGALGFIYGTTASFPGQNRRMEITGTGGTVQMVEDRITHWDFAETGPEDQLIREKYQKTKGGGGVADPAAINYYGHLRNIQKFLDAIDSRSKFEIDGYEARKAVDIINRIYKDSGLM
jgi:UDP-N-acetyl-2-amino-2-deoxyglucuronate dehydrogenase